ncbi:iron-containing redox enzyme family protein [Endozoicomonas sp. SM1973]|uniref:Iron-containing redox enzyme family protein n=1 Tax=Spartinivicinus marinus TaxID=2994442 RepID=A0A853I122_9GAMM|nr:iron-containing redox enzyme family protein [Spartinivicinus marinus]MCX4028630.1 iron-containing redox enzyme family protein [Spartinivicinus marinus]NYZ67103.1 iron-containing redox enzyme family protein [Spartinivicinus marinus]
MTNSDSQLISTQQVLRQLTIVWADFESRLLQVPIIYRAMNNQLQLEDYRRLLADHYHQVKEGSGWICRAASSITEPYLEQRAVFIGHATTEHQDYKMLERCYQTVGGDINELHKQGKNIGSEALSAWMYYKASQANPFDLIGAMFIIEGLGKQFARTFAEALQHNMGISAEQLEFYTYHAEHDGDHLDELEAILSTGILTIPDIQNEIIRTAKVTARLYLLQLEELGNY